MDAMERHYMLHHYIYFVLSISGGLGSFSFLFQFLVLLEHPIVEDWILRMQVDSHVQI